MIRAVLPCAGCCRWPWRPPLDAILPPKPDCAKVPAASHSAAPAAAAQSDQEEIKQNLAQLALEDRAAAEKQKICPVSGQPLGGMGKPYKTSVKGDGRCSSVVQVAKTT